MSEELFDELRVRFRETTVERLRDMYALLGTLDRDAEDAASLQKLLRHFHALAGLGTTYGYPRVTELGDQGEGALLPLTRSGAVPTTEMLNDWRSLARSVEKELAEGSAEVQLPSLEAEPRPFEVLVVEHDVELASLLSRALQDEGVVTRVRVTRADALAAIEESLPHALIVDVLLPDGSGYDVVEAMRERGGEAAGAIMTSAQQNFVDKLRAMKIGADAFVGKPLDLPALVRRVMAFRSRGERPARRILAVEDDTTQQYLIRKVLGGAGYEVAFCSDPALFEQKLVEFLPDLLLMDVYLADHEMRGYDLVRYVRQHELFSTMPVIFVTSATERQAHLESATAGGDLLVTKPVDWPMLLAQLETLLQRSTVMRERADRDALTGVLARAAFERRARQRSAAGGTQATLALLDLDHFKSINDTFGHAAGDRVLSSMGAMLRKRVRPSDVAGRYGGEEFAVLLEGVTAEQAVTIVERMLAEFSETDQGIDRKVTFSAGAATLDGSFDASFRRADAALYEAKRSGRARVVAAG